MQIKKSVFNLNSKKTAIVICRFSLEDEIEFSTLSVSEKKFLDSISSTKRRYEYFYGRLAIKNALKLLVPSVEFPNISILHNSNGAPTLQIDSLNSHKEENFNISISHSHNIASAIVTEANISCGIDIEFWNPNRELAFKKLSPQYSDKRELLISWVLKESLVKALGTGFKEDFSFYELENLDIQKNIAYCQFKNFKNYQGTAFYDENKSLAIVLNHQYHISSQELNKIWENL